MKVTESNAKLLSKFPWQVALIVVLGGLSMLFGIIIKNNSDDKKYQIERIEYLRNYIKNSETDKQVWLKEQTAKSDAEIKRQQILIDSLQRLILNRTDRNYQELKDILDIKSKDAVITIKPKKR